MNQPRKPTALDSDSVRSARRALISSERPTGAFPSDSSIGLRGLPALAVTVFVLALVPATTAHAQQIQVRDLNPDETQAMATITEGRVISTVSFLASDELAGRDTPSPELAIASSYVAARFRGAGLDGLGPDGSFFQNTSFPMLQPPAADAKLQIADADATTLKVIWGPLEDLELTEVVNSETEALGLDDPKIVVIDEVIVPPQAVDQPARTMTLFARRLRALTNKGVQVVLVRHKPNSLLLEIAAKLQRTPVPSRKGLTPDCCVLLVPEDLDLGDKSVTVDVDAQVATEAIVRNVVGVLRGSDEKLSKEAVLVSAHLDHIGRQTRGADRVNNGADDNATGVTTVVSLADAFAALKQRPKRSMIFVTFWGEEKGLLGSKHFVQEPLWPLSSIAANINIEMVGRPEADANGKAWMTGWKHSNLGSVMNAGSSRAGVEIFNRTDIGEMLYTQSDNLPFAQKGVVAHSFSAGSLHGDYHQPSDEWEKLDIPHMTKVIRGLFAGALVVAEGDVPVVKSN